MCLAMMAGCASRDTIRLEYAPATQGIPALTAKTFIVSVDDQRTYEWRQRRPPSYLGAVHGAGGDSLVFNDDDVSLGDQVGKDLRRELRSLGMVESYQSPAARIRVRVLAWSFLATTPARGHYIAEVSVADAKGKVIESSMIQLDEEIGSPNEGAAQFYAGFIRRLVRDNPAILTALEHG